ncbi:MAG: NADH-dependent [FeFe] hydrogenase, group A6 [Fusobacteriaceae bacterium]
MKDFVNIIINNTSYSVSKDKSILEAARENGYFIPSLCHHPDQKAKANCRICSVEVSGFKNLVTSCSTKVAEGMEIKTNTQKVKETVKTILELILADHPSDCLKCIRNGNCELRKLAARFRVNVIEGIKGNKIHELDDSTVSIVRDSSKCIKCGRCAEACHTTQQVGILYTNHRGEDVAIEPEYGKKLADVNCVLCGQCILACPVGALYEKDDTEKVWSAIHDEKKHVIVQIAPSIRVSVGEEFGMPQGSLTVGKLATSLRRLGFDKVFDTNFAADLTIMEEGHELLHRIKNNGVLPMLTSCSPGWINYIEKFHPELVPHLSTSKSPHMMFGAIAKTYYAEKYKIDPSSIVVVSIMPCTAKKYEASREEMNSSGFRDVDYVLTTRELVRMMVDEGIDFNNLPEGEFDGFMSEYSGAGAIFGTTGGVMEAALRTVYEVVTKQELKHLNFYDVRGMESIKSASVKLGDAEVKVGIAHGLSNAEKILQQIKSGESDYTFIEIMCCPGGCIGGGGQPLTTDFSAKQKRNAALYKHDQELSLRKSHENPEIIQLYDEFLKEPLGEKSHQLLHTYYLGKKESHAKH